MNSDNCTKCKEEQTEFRKRYAVAYKKQILYIPGSPFTCLECLQKRFLAKVEMAVHRNFIEFTINNGIRVDWQVYCETENEEIQSDFADVLRAYELLSHGDVGTWRVQCDRYPGGVKIDAGYYYTFVRREDAILFCWYNHQTARYPVRIELVGETLTNAEWKRAAKEMLGLEKAVTA